MHRLLFQQKSDGEIINLAKTSTNRFGPKPLNKKKSVGPMLIWAFAFSNLLQLTTKKRA